MGSGHEETLKTLHDAAAEIQACDDVTVACERTVRAAEDVLEFEMCSVILHEDGWLEPVALSSRSPADGVRRLRVDQGLAGKTFQTGESHRVDEITPDDESDPASASYRSGMSVPVGDVGVFQAVSTDVDGFDERDVEFAELLVAHTARTIDRIRYEAELERRRRTLERQNGRLEQFVDVVSHDLRNPLNVAAGRLALARENRDDDDLAVVATEHDRMRQLIDDLLVLAREGSPVEADAEVALASVAESYWGHVDTGSASLSVTATGTVRADEGRLGQLFENLFRNAVEHGSPCSRTESGNAADGDATGGPAGGEDAVESGGGALAVTVGDIPDGRGFFVADDGPGLPECDRERVFERGFSTAVDGTGFGLAIVREIADAHGWRLAATESEAGGARFDVVTEPDDVA
ncbi:GAF domain-containing sensor histidine kinase [Halorubellus sp. PRR65]|uniref:GAF domain-containing sensor histidine kinase n=1 Tax=Halorubellus sp. PRR65 TaxID=3098148 RepID=UPI002B259C7A|nr:GAF domain-containing sensor histidine kinase [Halorubellus sp. PRR65]